MRPQNESYKDIPGWGMDADPENEPTYPMKNYTGDDHKRSDYERSPQQRQTVEVLHSNERPGLSVVFGTTCPPAGLSGKIRRYAFRHSEDRYRHWLPLILADRINMVEGLIDDLKSGHVPNLIKERGLGMELKYNPVGMIKKVAVAAIAGALIFTWLKQKQTRS